MASPVGHTLAGYLGYVLRPNVNKQPPQTQWQLFGAIFLANMPDLDFLPGLITGHPLAFHRQATHTLIMALMVSGVVTLGGWLSSRLRPAETPLSKRQWLQWSIWVIALYLGHLALDLLMANPDPPFGLQLLWPFSNVFWRSPMTLIPGLRFEPVLSWQNLSVVAIELLWFTPLILLTKAIKAQLKPD